MFVSSIIKRRSVSLLQSSTHLARSYYTIPILRDELRENNGIVGLYSDEGFKMSWNNRANFYVENLNQLQGDSNQTIEDILMHNHSNPKRENIYRNASSLFNLNFAMNSLSSIVETESGSQTEYTSAEIPQPPTADELLKTPSISIETTNPILFSFTKSAFDK